MLDFMRNIRAKLREENGVALIMTMILLVVVGVLAAAFLTTSQGTTSVAFRQLDQKRAFWAAEAGVEHVGSLVGGLEEIEEGSNFGVYGLPDGKVYFGEDYDGSYDIDIDSPSNVGLNFDDGIIIVYEGFNNDSVTFEFESEGSYNGMTQKVSRDVTFEIDVIPGDERDLGYVENPWNLYEERGNFFAEEIEEEALEIRLAIRENKVENPNDANIILEDIKDEDKSQHGDLDVENYNFEYEEAKDGFYYYNVDFNFNNVEGHSSHMQYVDMTFNLDDEYTKVRAVINTEDEIENLYPGEINRIGGTHSEQIYHFFGFRDKDGWPVGVNEDPNEVFDATTTLDNINNGINGEVIVEDGDRTLDENDIIDSILYIEGDLTIDGYSAVKIINSNIFVEGDVRINGGPQGVIENSAFFVLGDVDPIKGQTKQWADNIVFDPDEYNNGDDPIPSDPTYDFVGTDFTNWSVE